MERLREEGGNVCAGTGESVLRDLQDPPIPAAATSAMFPVSTGEEASFQTSSFSHTFLYTPAQRLHMALVELFLRF